MITQCQLARARVTPIGCWAVWAMQNQVGVAPMVFGSLGSADGSASQTFIRATQTAYARRGARWGRLAVLGHLGDIVIVFKSHQPKTPHHTELLYLITIFIPRKIYTYHDNIAEPLVFPPFRRA